MRESEKREDGLLTDPFERIKPLRDTGFGVARADGTAVDFAFAWQGGSGLWYTVESAYDALDEEAGDIYVEPDLLDAVLGSPAGSDSVHVWYRSAFPEDGLGEKIDPDLTFREAEKAVALGGGFYDALGVGDSVVRERVFGEIARRDGIDYGDVYEAWSEKRALPGPDIEKLTLAVASYQMDNRLAVPSEHRDRAAAAESIADFVYAKAGAPAARKISEDIALGLVPSALVSMRGRAAFDIDVERVELDGETVWQAAFTDTLLDDAASRDESFYDTFNSVDDLMDYIDAFKAQRGLIDGSPDAPEGSIRAVLIPTNGFPREIWLPRDADGDGHPRALLESVGGLIDLFAIPADELVGADLIVNDDGLATCPPNRAIYATEAMAEAGYLTQLDYRTTVKPDDLYTVLHGDIVAVGHDPLVGDFISLTDAQVQKVTDYFTDKSAPGSGELEEAAILVAEHEKKVDIVAADLSAALEGSAADFEATIDALLDSCLGRDDSDDGER